ncbi:MAG: 4-hydroxybutyrate CoA-transferase [Myxococcota bacterium]|jgi:4-hydroxybutyrate CoA-transferase
MLPMQTLQEAVLHIQSGMNVFVHGAAMTPTELLEALCQRPDLHGVTLYHLHLDGPAPMAEPAVAARVRSVSLFTGASMRAAVRAGHADFVPVFLKDIPGLFRSGTIRLDAALLQLSPPDRHGNCSLGTSVDTALEAASCAELVIALINPKVPRTHGYSTIPAARITAATQTDRPLWAHPAAEPNPITDRIGQLIADLVPDGACLQTGIGAIPDAVLRRLGNKVDLGVHTEMFSDGLIPLIEAGVVNNRRKEVHTGRTVTSFVAGTQKLYDFVDENVRIAFHPCDRTNDINLIRKNRNVIAINSGIAIDLSGQVCADSIGDHIFSGIGGQMDFMQGAAQSEGGKPIMALPSTAAGGTISRITARLRPGSGVVTTRGHVQWVVTEYGMVNLHGRTLRERAEQLIGIAHPDFRATLSREIREIRHFDIGKEAGQV